MYICEQCSSCLFYDHDRDFGDSCYFYTEEGDKLPQPLTWLSANDMEKNPKLYDIYHKPCPAFVSMKETLKEKKQEAYRSYIERILIEVI